MRRIFTSIFLVVALVVTSHSSYAQCGGVQYDFNTAGTSGFTGAGATFAGTGTALRFSNVSNGTLTLTTPMLTLVGNPGTIDFGFIYSLGSQASISAISVTVRYVNTLGQIVTTTPQSISPFTSPICTSIAKPGDMTTSGASANSYELIFTFTTTGNGSSGAATITIDDYRTSSTAAQGVLPVKFQALEATPSSSAVALKWAVGIEDNLKGYEIEKSDDGRNYIKIGSVSASGQSSYSFVDSKLTPLSYYRIKSIDIDGKFAYSTVALVKAGKSMIVLKAFPSPIINTVAVQHPTAVAGSTITINSEDGRLIKSKAVLLGTQQTEIDLSAAKPGLYIIRFRDGNGNTESLKILKK